MVQRTNSARRAPQEIAVTSLDVNEQEPVVRGVSDNKVRSFLLYAALERPLMDFLEQGDGLNALAVFEERYFPDSQMIDSTLINAIKFISTSFGRARFAQGSKILERIERDNIAKKPVRFRSRHPLFTDGTSRYQNACLISGMVHLGIPILPYFDGHNVLEEDESPDEYLEKLRAENRGLF